MKKVITPKVVSTKKVKVNTESSPKKPITKFRPQVRSRHPSHNVLRTELAHMPFRSVIRLGSTTVLPDEKMEGRIEINKVEGVKNSMDKLRMKKCFQEKGVITPEWYTFKNTTTLINSTTNDSVSIDSLEFPMVLKHRFGSRGSGNYLIKSIDDFKTLIKGKTLSDYIVERYYNYSKEYRIHIDCYGNVIYTNRKRLKKDTPEANRWYLNDSNSKWFLETSPEFEKPSNWDVIVAEAKKAINAVGLDVCAIDLRVQNEKTESGKKRKEVKFVIIETNSAPQFGEGTTKKYLESLPALLQRKANDRNNA